MLVLIQKQNIVQMEKDLEEKVSVAQHSKLFMHIHRNHKGTYVPTRPQQVDPVSPRPTADPAPLCHNQVQHGVG